MIACTTLAESLQLLVDLAMLIVAIVGLWFVVLQLRQVKEQLYLQHFSDYTKRYQEIILAFPESINENSFNLADHADRESVMRRMRAYTDLCFEEWFLWKNFTVNERVWATWNSGMNTAFSKTAFRQAWAAIKKDTEYGSSFTAFIDEKVACERTGS